MELATQHSVFAIDTMTKKLASYTMLVSFVVMLLISIWKICGPTDNIVVDTIVVLIAGAFLYDLWRFADFKETQFSMSQINNMVREEE